MSMLYFENLTSCVNISWSDWVKWGRVGNMGFGSQNHRKSTSGHLCRELSWPCI